MLMDVEIRRILAERRQRLVRPPGAPIIRYRIMSRTGGTEVLVEKGEFSDEQSARSRMEKLRPGRGSCYVLYDSFRRGGSYGGPIMKKGDCEAPVKEEGDPECLGGCYRLDDLFERAVAMQEPERRTIAARKLWLKWVKKLKQAATSAEAVGWGKSSFKSDWTTDKLRVILGKFCKGQIPMPQAESAGRFGALFELVLPDKTMGYPTGLAYTAQPVGSLRGVGVSLSAAGDIEAERFQNYLDAGIIKSRKRGEKSSRVGAGKVVQHPKARS
jgi:hypothetical protein